MVRILSLKSKEKKKIKKRGRYGQGRSLKHIQIIKKKKIGNSTRREKKRQRKRRRWENKSSKIWKHNKRGKKKLEIIKPTNLLQIGKN